mgnify:CR=1 FL=1
MMGKTHIAVGIAAAYLITQPQTAPEFIIATVGGSIGGVMADIDVKIDTSNKYAAKASMDALYGEILAIAISVGALAGDYFTGGNILQGAVANLTRFIIGAVLFIVLTIISPLLGKEANTGTKPIRFWRCCCFQHPCISWNRASDSHI